MEQWTSNNISVSKRQLYELVNHENALSRLTGLQLIGVLLVNGFPLYDRKDRFGDNAGSNDISEFKYLDGLLSNLNYAMKDVYTATAEVIYFIIRISG